MINVIQSNVIDLIYNIILFMWNHRQLNYYIILLISIKKFLGDAHSHHQLNKIIHHYLLLLLNDYFKFTNSYP